MVQFFSQMCEEFLEPYKEPFFRFQTIIFEPNLEEKNGILASGESE